MKTETLSISGELAPPVSAHFVSAHFAARPPKADEPHWSARYLLPAALSYNRGQPGRFIDWSEN